MKTIIHDLNSKDVKKFKIGPTDKIINAGKCKNYCIGCFSCWIKHPKKCIYQDDFSNMVEYLKASDELIIISKCRYGCYSATIKQVLERCLGYVLPYFTERFGEMHHTSRYSKQLKLRVYFYGDISSEAKKAARALVNANGRNFYTSNNELIFVKDLKEIRKCIL